jgi:hypothetical protein
MEAGGCHTAISKATGTHSDIAAAVHGVQTSR